MNGFRLFSSGTFSFLTIVLLILAAPDAGRAAPGGGPQILANESSELIPDAGSHPGGFCQIGNITYFAAKSHPAGIELWRTDGTAAGTFMVRDINLNFVDAFITLFEPSSSPSSLVNLNSTLYFTALTEVGRELWKSDGTQQGTKMVKDISPGRFNGVRGPLTVFQNHVYFAGSQILDFNSLGSFYKSDGTAAGTDYLRDGVGGPLIENVREIVVSNNTMYVATNGAIWVTDGTGDGSLEIPMPADTEIPLNLTDVEGTVFFTLQEKVNESTSIRKLWKTDGSVAGTVKVTDKVPGDKYGALISELASFKGKLYFSATTADDGPELWVSDGTDVGTHELVNINSGTIATETGVKGFGSYPNELTVVGNELWFGADDSLAKPGLIFPSDARRDPWITDGTALGTRKVIELDNSDIGGDIEVVPSQFTAFNGSTYFIATYEPAPIVGDPHSGEAIATMFRSDGTAGGTVQVAENYLFDGYAVQGSLIKTAAIFARPDMLLLNGGRGARLQSTSFGYSANSELHKSDGTDEGTVLLKEIHAYPVGRNLNSGFALNDKFYFAQPLPGSSEALAGLFSSDGLTVTPEDTPGDFRNIWNTDKHIYVLSRQGSGQAAEYHLSASDGINGFENVFQVDNFYDISYFIPWGDRALFSRQKQSDDLWVTDGTSSGTVKVFDQNLNNIFNEVKVINPSAALFQNVQSFSQGPEMWSTDGTVGGTFKLKGLTGGKNDDISRVTSLNGKGLFFTNMNYGGTPVVGGGRHRLVETDGTNEGTNTVIDGALYISGDVQFYPSFGTAGSKMYFTYKPDTYPVDIGEELWAYDQTETTITLVKDIWPGAPGSQLEFPYKTIEYQGYLFFSANDGVHGNELWRSDGTEEGTIMVKDIEPGLMGSFPSNFTKVGDSLIFAAGDPMAGYELFVLEDADAEPRLVSDLNPGNQPSTPRNFAEVKPLDQVFFTADNNAAGTELWVLSTQLRQTAARLWKLFE